MVDSMPSLKNDFLDNSLQSHLHEPDGVDPFIFEDNRLWSLDDYFPTDLVESRHLEIPEPTESWRYQPSQINTLFACDNQLSPSSRYAPYEESLLSDSGTTTPVTEPRASLTRSNGDDTCYTYDTSFSSAMAFGSGLMHLESGPPWFCEECRKVFRTSKDLERHAKISRHRPYVCSEAGCRKTFSRRDTFVRHKTIHKGSEFHTCQICLQSNKRSVFKRKDHLHQHEKNCHFTGSHRSSGREFLL